MKAAGYNDSVFINCPFDQEYIPILRAIVYGVYRCGFFPKTALDEDDGYPRFNMPFELGIFFGARMLGDEIQKRKNALILEKEKYSYQKYISDLNGIDTKAHNNDPVTAISKLRDWLRTASGRTTIPGYSILTAQYQEFQDHLPALTRQLGFTVDNIPFIDFVILVEDAVKAQVS